MNNVSMLHKVTQLLQKFQLVLVVVEFINQVKEIWLYHVVEISLKKLKNKQLNLYPQISLLLLVKINKFQTHYLSQLQLHVLWLAMHQQL